MSASVQNEVSIGEYSRTGDGRGEDLRRFRLAGREDAFCLGPKSSFRKPNQHRGRIQQLLRCSSITGGCLLSNAFVCTKVTD